MIDQHTLTTLEFSKILKLIEGKCRTPFGHDEARKYVPLYDKTEIDRRLSEVSQMKDIILFGAAFPLSRMEDCREWLERSQVEGIFLAPDEILQILELVEVSIEIHGYNPDEREKFPAIVEYIKQTRAFPELRKEIRKTIDEDGNIRDNASSKLKHIRIDLADAKRKIIHQLERILASRPKQSGWQDDVITQRSGRYVIPVPASQYQSDIGMLHDRSQSGSTYFIEPKETVEINNRIHLLMQEERIELDRILRALTAEIGSRAEALKHNTKVIGQLDAIYAAAGFAKQIKANRPIIVEESAFNLIKARHPLLMVQFKDQKLVIPTTIAIGRDRQAVIVTGPNTGGKTIALKTIGLMVLMAQSGLLIPADEKSEVGIFDKVYTDIGDEQSIELSLSTFSSHIKNVISATRAVSSDSLVLFDEIGAGTDPKEGASLAEAIITFMLDRGARLVATTHYSQLKTLPLERPEIDNASLEFDRKTLAPTYNLQVGIPGSSYAVEIASRLGMPETICDHASSLLGVSERSLTELISSLEAELAQVRKDRSELTERLSKATELETFYREQSTKLKKEVEARKEDALAETMAILDHTRKETERLVADIRKTGAAGETVKEAHRKLKSRKEQVLSARKKLHGKHQKKQDLSKFTVGDMVRIISLNQEGEITEMIGNNKARVRVGGITTTAELRNLHHLGRQSQPAGKKNAPGVEADTNLSPEIHLMGMTVDEAREALDRFIYQAVVASLKQIYVIHGKGTGRLRKGLVEYLKSHPEVESMRMGNWNEGGAGVTIVKLKE